MMEHRTLPRSLVDSILAVLEIPVEDVKSVYIEPGLGSVTVRLVKGRPQYFDLI